MCLWQVQWWQGLEWGDLTETANLAPCQDTTQSSSSLAYSSSGRHTALDCYSSLKVFIPNGTYVLYALYVENITLLLFPSLSLPVCCSKLESYCCVQES